MKKKICMMLAIAMIFSLCGCINITISTDSNNTSSSSSIDDSNNSSSAVNTDDSPEDLPGYVIVCVDSDTFEPVTGVSVQLCTDQQCMQKTTNSEGYVNFDVPAGEWDVHIDDLPNGYSYAEPSTMTTQKDSLVYTIYIFAGDSSSSDSNSNTAPITYSAVVPSAEHGYISGQTFTISGEPVDFNSIFADKNITLLNVFKHGCGPCYEEFSDLKTLNDEISEIGGQVVLVLRYTMYPCEETNFYAIDQEKIAAVREDLSEYGADGLKVVLYTTSITDATGDDILAFPTSYLVNSEGKVISNEYDDDDGRTADDYARWIKKHLQ